MTDEVLTALQVRKATPYLENYTYLDKSNHKRRLTPKVRMWCYFYVMTGFNVLKATQISYNTIKRENKQEERQLLLGIGRENSIKPFILEVVKIIIEKELEKQKNKLPKLLLDNLMLRAFYDPAEFFYKNGRVKPLDKIPIELRKSCIDQVERKLQGANANEVVNYKLADKDKARGELIKWCEFVKENFQVEFSFNTDNKRKEIDEIINDKPLEIN